MDYESLTDEALIPLIAKHDDTRAYAELYDRYWTLLVGILFLSRTYAQTPRIVNILNSFATASQVLAGVLHRRS